MKKQFCISNRIERAIRYAASYATIKTLEDLIAKIYAPYIEKHKEEFAYKDLTSTEIATRKLTDFLRLNHTEKDFNEVQRIMLVASDFDKQTLSAVAWLNYNRVDISCHKLIPYLLQEELLLDVEKVLPVGNNEDYYVDFLVVRLIQEKKKSGITRRNLPRIEHI